MREPLAVEISIKEFHELRKDSRGRLRPGGTIRYNISPTNHRNIYKGTSEECYHRFYKEGYRILICDISIFELLAKAVKYINMNLLQVERIIMGIISIIYDEEFISPYEDEILINAFKLRSMLNDFIGCIIFSTAMNRCDILLIENKEFKNYGRTKNLMRSRK